MLDKNPLLLGSGLLHGAALAAGLSGLCPWPVSLGLLAAHHVGLGAVGMWPRSRVLGPNIVRLPTRSAVAITFDDGPDPAVTPAVLDILDAFDTRATFFCIGERVSAYPDLARAMIRRGHGVENHSFSHPHYFACLGPAGLRREILTAQTSIAMATGVAPLFFRAPMGLRSPLLQPELARAGLRLATWSRRGFDTRKGNAAGVLRLLTEGAGPGAIFMLHDGNGNDDPAGKKLVLSVLPMLLRHLATLGLASVTLRQAFYPAATDAPAPAVYA